MDSKKVRGWTIALKDSSGMLKRIYHRHSLSLVIEFYWRIHFHDRRTV